MLAGEMVVWWLSDGAGAQGQSIAQLPCPLFFSFSSPYRGNPHLLVFFWVGSSTWACSGGLIFIYLFIFVSHLLNHVGMWDLIFVPIGGRKNYSHSIQPKLS
jgi:hypothetical protein